MNRDTDKRVERSRSLLMAALLQLMQGLPYHKISVAQICAASGVARPTFYLHFNNKDDLLRAYIESMFLAFYEQVDAHLVQRADNDPLIAELMFRQWSDNATFARLLVQDDVEALMLSEFRRYVGRIMQRYISAHRLPVADDRLQPYIIDFLAGASFMVIVRWIKDDFPVGAAEMGALYANLVRPGLVQVLLSGRLPLPR